MQTERTILDDMKHQYKTGGVFIRLIFINSIIFLLINLLLVIGRLSASPAMPEIVSDIFSLQTNFPEFIRHPWGLITHMFSHQGFFHFLMNMLVLYFVGGIFMQYFTGRRLLYTYVLGGLFGGLMEVLAHFLPSMNGDSVIGASGAVMAIFIAVAVHKPRLKVNLFGVLPVQIYILAGLYFLSDFLRLGTNDGTAHFAHLGGGVLGMISVLNLNSSANIINMAQKFGDWFKRLFSRDGASKAKRSQKKPRVKTDEEYNMEAKERQAVIDKILDKISKSGYESLTKKEKDFLFKQSKNG